MQPKPADLTRIAQDMRRELARQPRLGSLQRLLGDYAVILHYQDTACRLYVGLRTGWPTLEQTLPFAEAFGVPPADQQPEGQTIRLESRIGANIRIKTMCYRWTEDLPAAASTPAAAARPVQVRQLTIFGPADMGPYATEA